MDQDRAFIGGGDNNNPDTTHYELSGSCVFVCGCACVR